MTVQINTEDKTIRVVDKVNLKELSKFLDKVFPKGEWKEYSLETNTYIYNNYPVTYWNWNTPYIPYSTSDGPVITYTTNTN